MIFNAIKLIYRNCKEDQGKYVLAVFVDMFFVPVSFRLTRQL